MLIQVVDIKGKSAEYYDSYKGSYLIGWHNIRYLKYELPLYL